MRYCVPFSSISISDIATVGGKNASLGEMYSGLSGQGVKVPNGFAVTADGYRKFVAFNGFGSQLNSIIDKLDKGTFSNLTSVGRQARELIASGSFPEDLKNEILSMYHESGGMNSCAVAVRSSATAEDLPSASFAGQMESFLNISGDEQLIRTVHRCYASLYTDRAIKYRTDHGFSNMDIAVSVGIQRMVRSDLSASGVAFTLDPDTGFDKVIVINSIYGLGENIVQGRSTPDEFLIFKNHIGTAFNPIISKNIGGKEWTMVYSSGESEPVRNIETDQIRRSQFSLGDDNVKLLAQWCLKIEQHYKRAMDIEWALDGETGEMFIIQARPETVHAKSEKLNLFRSYTLLKKGAKLTEGIALGEKISTGRARILTSPSQGDQLQKGEVLVTDITNPDWDPLMKKAAAIITNKGGRTSHAAIVARELGTVAVVGCGNATEQIKDGQMVSVSCAEGRTGFVYDGIAEWKEEARDISGLKDTATQPMLILGDPSQAMKLASLPARGVGLMRMEFLITHHISVHPLALTRFGQIQDKKVCAEIEKITSGYSDKKQFFIDKLAYGVAVIAAAFYPHDVIVRMSDFKSNEYAKLIGGSSFEPEEENPMIGFRGASRYYSPLYKDGFGLECAAMKKVREELGFENVKLMIPFCRTVEEGKNVLATMKEFGLERGKNGLEVYVMVEIPSNVLLAEQFAEIFDGFSIGSNDLTQLTLGLDRDSALVSSLFSEKNEAVMWLIGKAIDTARAKGIKIGLCGQAPSDMPEFAQFLVKKGIHSISFTSDALIRGIENIVEAESGIGKH